jgi:hypothetical protein
LRGVRRSIVVAALLLAGCGGADPQPTATATATATETAAAKAGADCPADLDSAPKRQPPSYMGVLSYSHLYRSEGRRIFYAWLDGAPSEVLSRRDDAQNELVQSWGFASLKTGESGDVATARLEGNRHAVDVQVKPLCGGKLRLRYTVKR